MLIIVIQSISNQQFINIAEIILTIKQPYLVIEFRNIINNL